MKKTLKAIDLYKVYSNWCKDLGIFRCFFRATNFVTLKHYPDFCLKAVGCKEADLYKKVESIVRDYDPGKTLFFLDISGAQAIETAFLLRREMGIKPVFTFNNVMHPNALIGRQDYISNLLGYGQILEDCNGRGYVFTFDQDRYGEYSEKILKDFFNNQYELGEEDLPPVEMLKHIGYDTVLYIYEIEQKEDVKSYFDYLTEQGIKVIKEEL